MDALSTLYGKVQKLALSARSKTTMRLREPAKKDFRYRPMSPVHMGSFGYKLDSVEFQHAN